MKKPKPENKYDKIKEWVKEDFNILLASLFLGIIIAIFSLATAIFSQKLIDVILPSEDITKLIIGLVLFGFILLARAGLGFVRSTFLITQSRDFNNRMITSFFHGLLGLPKPFFDSKKTGDMIARMNDTRRIQLTVSSLVGNLLIEFLVVLVSLAGVYIYSWQIGLVVTAILPIYIFILWKYNKPIITAQKDVMGKYSLNEANYVDVISGIPEIKSSGTGKLFHKVTTTFYQLFQQSIFNLGKIQVRFNLKTELIEIVLMLTVIAFASYLVITGQLMLGVLVAVLSLSGSIGPSLTRIALFNIQLQEAKVAFNRMEEFTSLDPEETKGEKIDTIHSIEIKNMYFTFPGSLELLKNINMEICKGQITTLLGESGVGKSTLLQIIQRFYQPNAGEILCNGKNAEGYDLDVYRTLFGAVSQDVKIFNNYLLFNIALTDDPEVLQKVPQWCQENGFDQFFAKFPQG
ncbi:MAG: ABC transporter transmembrane domain-containing protein, partial [Candidatus Cyclobacteriaceae bacterium M3_2C_046]